MRKLVAMSTWRSIAVALVVGAAASAQAGQNAPNVGGIFGAILNSALANQAREQWQHLPLSDYNCLEAHNMSAEQLAANGIAPGDPRVQRVFAQCARDAASQPSGLAVAPAPTGRYNPDFQVDGLVVGNAVFPDSPSYKTYKCRPSEQFAGFTWCGAKRAFSGKAGHYDSWETILHSDANLAVFILQDVIPAYFAPGDVEREIQRLSAHFGQPAKVYNGAPRSDAPHSVIATWGDVTLTQLDQATTDALSRGETITAGLLVDFLGDSRKSAREGLPVFHIGGGAGYIWAAKYDDGGKGRLRVTAVNPSLLPRVTAEQTPPAVSAYTPAVTPAPTLAAQAQPAPDPVQVEKERAARTDKAVAAAKAQLADVGGFIQEHPQSPKLLDYIDRISALSAAVKSDDADAIERTLTELNNSLSHDKDYQQHLTDLAGMQKKRAARDLGDAIRRGEQERDFVLDYIAKNPLADVTPTFAGYVKQLNSALLHADLTQLQPLVDKVDLEIREANLEAAFIATQKQVSNSREKAVESVATSSRVEAPNASAVKPERSENLPITEKNRFLVGGDLDDVEILYNASPSAPHVAENLRGDFVFAQNRARVCLFGKNPDELALTAKEAISAKADPRQIAVQVEPCDPEQLLTYDIIATQRSAFLRAKKEDAFRRFAEVTAADQNKAADAERARIEKIKANVADGAPDGFGIVLLSAGSPTLCLAVGASVPSHRQLLLLAEGRLNLEMRTEVVIKDTTIDDAFINLQKRQCGAVYASAADLKTLTGALARNNTTYTFSSVWYLPSDVAREDAALAEKAKIAAQEETERAQRNADRVRLASARAQDLNATQAAQQATLRRKFGDSAKAAASSLGSEIIDWTKNQSGQIGNLYPAYAAWLADKIADHWEIMTIDTELQDFGISSFKARLLDTTFSRITLHLKNRMLGEYKDACFIFGRINDTEFSMLREPAFAKCDDEAGIKAWQSGHQFKSEWFASY
jgi:hypothetical protein